MNYYEVLGIDKYASIKEIDKSYKSLVKKLTSGVLESEIPISRSMLQKVEQAHATLSNESLRKRYDDSLQTQPPAEEDDPAEIVRFKNIQGHQYFVNIKKDESGKVAIPLYCACCMSTDCNLNDETFVKNIESHYRYRIETTLSVKFPVCAECSEHIKKKDRLYYIAVLLPSIIAAVLSGMIRGLSAERPIGLSILLPFLAAGGLFLAIASSLRFKRLSMMHSTNGKPAIIKGFNDYTRTFQFSNWMFANMFASVNKGEMTEKRTRRFLNHRSLLLAFDGLTGLIVSLFILTALAIGISFIFV